MYVCTYVRMYVRRYVRRHTYLPRVYITLNIMGITQGWNKIGYDFENELKNLYNTNQNLLICSPTVIPMGTDRQMDGQTNKQTNGQIFTQIFRDKLSFLHGSLDYQLENV